MGRIFTRELRGFDLNDKDRVLRELWEHVQRMQEELEKYYDILEKTGGEK